MSGNLCFQVIFNVITSYSIHYTKLYETDKIINDFSKFAKKEYDIDIDRGGLSRSKQRIKNDLKAEIARQLWVEEGYYRVQNRIDPELKQALKALE